MISLRYLTENVLKKIKRLSNIFLINRGYIKTYLILYVVVLYLYSVYHQWSMFNLEHNLAREAVEKSLEENLLYDKGMGCDFPKLNPFAPEIMRYDSNLPPRTCSGRDWVRCYMSKCRIDPTVHRRAKIEACTIRDIIYENDIKYGFGPPTELKGYDEYVLDKSDHIFINCTARKTSHFNRNKFWMGVATGFRKSYKPKRPPIGREKTINVLILGFDSTSRNGFIRKMPNSYKVLNDELKATILNGYNIVGDGTPAALFPILTGKTELELPEVRKSVTWNSFIDHKHFIFHKLQEDGYRTLYFEDMAFIGTFQLRFNGFRYQPTDHYLRPLILEVEKRHGRAAYCIGDTLSFMLMLNLTDQFFRLKGKRFAFTFISDISHDDFNMISSADNATEEFLRGLKSQGILEDTMLLVMGDHGQRTNVPFWNIAALALKGHKQEAFHVRYEHLRKTIQGRLEERLPFIAIRVPDILKKYRPDIQEALESNADVLTTPHDIYATLLDAVDMTEHWNTYKIKGADLTRGLTLFKAIPRNRSCSESGIEPHWCTCLRWEDIPPNDVLFLQSGQALVDRINEFLEPVRHLCLNRTLSSIQWVTTRRFNKQVLEFESTKFDGYSVQFGRALLNPKKNIQVKIATQPGSGEFEASMTYINGKFYISPREISRTNAYRDEPNCISKIHPHLNAYCYCKENVHKK